MPSPSNDIDYNPPSPAGASPSFAFYPSPSLFVQNQSELFWENTTSPSAQNSETPDVAQIVLIVVLILVCLFVNCRKRAILPELAGYKNIGYNNIEMSNVNNIVGYEEYQPQEQKMNVPYDEENLPKKD